MKLTPRLEKAIKKASILHSSQRRKGKDNLPYISHLISVAVILSDYTDNEDVIIAGLLHDTIEDTEYTKENLESDFGETVMKIVLDVSEDKEKDGEMVPWKVRKTAYADHLKVASRDALLVSVADKIHNLRSTITALNEEGDEAMSIFSRGKEMQLWFNESVLAVLKERLDSGLVEVYENTIEEAKIAFK